MSTTPREDPLPAEERLVSDEALIAAIDNADSRAVNGLPGPKTIARECDYAPGTVRTRVKQLADSGVVDLHMSTILATDMSGNCLTVEISEGEK